MIGFLLKQLIKWSEVQNPTGSYLGLFHDYDLENCKRAGGAEMRREIHK